MAPEPCGSWAVPKGDGMLRGACGKVNENGGRLTPSEGEGYLTELNLVLHVRPNAPGAVDHGTDIQSAESEAAQQARIPCPDGHEGRAEDPQPPPEEGAASAHREGGPEVTSVVLPGTPGDSVGECGFPRHRRLRRGPDIRAVLRSGRRERGGPMEVVHAPGDGARSRFGTIVPLYGGSAVRRNLMKRRLREIGRQEVLPRLDRAGLSLDFLVRIRPGAYSLSFEALRETLIRITERLCSDH